MIRRALKIRLRRESLGHFAKPDLLTPHEALSQNGKRHSIYLTLHGFSA
jgi:hypothetical protein